MAWESAFVKYREGLLLLDGGPHKPHKGLSHCGKNVGLQSLCTSSMLDKATSLWAWVPALKDTRGNEPSKCLVPAWPRGRT